MKVNRYISVKVRGEKSRRGLTFQILIALAALSLLWSGRLPRRAAAQGEPLRVTANFSERQPVTPTSQLELRTTRALAAGEGRLAIFVGETDVTALCAKDGERLTYSPRAVRLPVGETSVVVYLVSADDVWTEVARLPLVVEEPKPPRPEEKRTGAHDASAAAPETKDGAQLTNASAQVAQPGAQDLGGGTDGRALAPAPAPTPAPQTPAPARQKKPEQMEFLPSVSVNVKAQSVVLFFPQSSRPDRINFTDVGVQASLRGNYKNGGLTVQNEFDLAGSSVQNEALRFSDLGKNAMQVDLSSYLMQYQFHKLKLSVGHVSFGSSHHLIDHFSSRGISFTLPLTKRLDISAAALNGTSIVGFNNFFGLSNTEHQLFTGTIGFEFLPKRPGGLRLEVSALKGSLLPRTSFNQQNVNDAEKSRGESVRLTGSDKAGRFRFDAGFTRSWFTNPADPLLYQGRNVVAVRPVTRSAHFLDINYDLLRGLKLTKTRPLSLSLAFRHEKVDPLFRSIAAFAQADRLNNQLDVTGSFGDINFTAGETRASDNLAGIRSILKTLTRRQAFSVAAPASSLVGKSSKPSKWLPRLAFSFDRTHQLAAFVPVGGDFNSLSQIPNQISTSQIFAADWQFSQRLRLSYHFNYSFQDNRQLTRERADLLDEVNGVTVGTSPLKTLDLNFDVSAERTSNFEQNALNTTLRLGTNITWRIRKTMTWAFNGSTTGAGDRFGLSHRRDADFDAQFAWRFLALEKDRFRKVQGQFFLRYENRYGLARDLLTGFNTLTKFQAVNAGLNFTFF